MIPPPPIAAGRLTLYQFYDLGDSIDLDRAQASLTHAVTREPPGRVRQPASIEVAQPPLRVDLGELTVTLDEEALSGVLRASVYDLGVVALALELPLSQPTPWDTVAGWLWTWQDPPGVLADRFRAAVDDLEAAIRPAIVRPKRGAIVEDYAVLVVDGLTEPVEVASLATNPWVLAALLGERRPLSASAARLVTPLSYFPDDLALLSWDGALLIDPDPRAVATAADLLEFANVELLVLRSYDAQLDDELPAVYRRIEAARGRFRLPLVRRYSLLLQEVQGLVVDVTEITERVDNALKVTDDVYWNRLYSAALDVLRVQVWRQGVQHKLDLLRETYGMLHDDAEAERSTALEWIVILLIAFEVIWALLARH